MSYNREVRKGILVLSLEMINIQILIFYLIHMRP